MGTITDVIIREVRLVDYDALARFFEGNDIPRIVQHFHPFPLTSETANNIARTSHLDHYYVALLDDRIVGLSMLRGWDEGFSVPSFGIVVDQHFHGRGFGKRMLEHALEEARRLGCQYVMLSVYASNGAALQLYQSMGFREDTREPVMVAQKPDEKIVMLKGL